MELLGWSQSKISRLETGATPYNQDDLETAAELYNCSKADLITRPPGGNIPPINDIGEITAFLNRIDWASQHYLETVLGVIESGLKKRETPEQRDDHDGSSPQTAPHAAPPSRQR